MAENALHLHFDEWPFVDSSGQNKLVTNNGVTIAPVPGDIVYTIHFGPSDWVCLANCSWTVDGTGSYFKETGPGLNFRPAGSWFIGYRPDVVRVTSKHTSPWTFRLRDEAGNTVALGAMPAGSVPSPAVVVFPITYVEPNDLGPSISPSYLARVSNASGRVDNLEWGFTTSSGVSGGTFDGSSDLVVDKANTLTPNNEDWEIDLIVDHTNLTGTQTYYSQYEDADNRCHLNHLPGAGYGLHFLYRYNGTDLISLSGAGGEITDTDEHHVALTKEGDTFRLFLDGVNVAETIYAFSSSELIDSDIYIGQDGNSANYFNGDMLTLRISNTTRFTQDFTPDMSGTLVTDEFTQLLINFDAIEDEAEAGLSIWNPTQVTRGNVDTGVRIYRFGNQCGYFPGAQSGFAPYSLQLPDHPNWNIGDRDFTLDTWVHPLSHFNYAGIIHQNTRWYWYIDSAGKLNWYIEDGGPPTFSMQSSGTVPIDEWSHLALTRTLGPTGGGNEPLDIYMLPDGPVGGSFLTVGGCVGWNCMNNGINSGTPNDGTYVEILSDDWIRVTFDSPSFVGTSTQIKVHTRGRSAGGVLSDTRIDLYSDGVSLDGNNHVSYPVGSFANRTSTFSVAKTAAQLTNLEVRLYGGAPSSEDEISELEVEIVGPTEGIPIPEGIGQVWRMYIKGIRQAQTEENFTIPNLTGPLWIGRGTSTADLFHGYMDELRLLLGKAVWTDNEFWPYDYPYFSEPVGLRVPTYRRRIHSIKGR